MEVLLDELLRLVSEIVTGIRNQVINCTVETKGSCNR